VVLRLRLQHLRMLMALGASVSVQEAARRMHLTQSAASKLLGDVERAFGSKLFDRGRLALHATPAGRALLRRAERLIRDVEAAGTEQSLFRQGATATLLLVGGLPLALATLMTEVLHRCRNEWPELVLQLREATGRQLLRDIQGAIVDCGLGRIGSEDPVEYGAADLQLDELTQEELVIVARPDHRLANRRRIQPGELHGFEWITPAMGSTAYSTFAAALQREGLGVPRPAVECDASFGTILAFIERFGFLGLLPRTIAVRHAAAGNLKVLKLSMQIRLPPIAFICRRDRADSAEIVRIRRIVRAAAGRPPRGA
jgi:DNA-binding transcriptional LysR family regulator